MVSPPSQPRPNTAPAGGSSRRKKASETPFRSPLYQRKQKVDVLTKWRNPRLDTKKPLELDAEMRQSFVEGYLRDLATTQVGHFERCTSGQKTRSNLSKLKSPSQRKQKTTVARTKGRQRSRGAKRRDDGDGGDDEDDEDSTDDEGRAEPKPKGKASPKGRVRAPRTPSRRRLDKIGEQVVASEACGAPCPDCGLR